MFRCRYNMLICLAFLLMLCSCEMIMPDYVKHVVLMWSTDESDPAYADWSKKIKKEFDRQGLHVELHNYYGTIGSVMEVEQKRRMIEFVHNLDSIGKTPDLILSCGDYMHWQLELNTDTLVNSIPAVCYALKNDGFLDRQNHILRERGLDRQNLVEIHDTLQLKESLDFCAYLENLRPVGTANNKIRSNRFVALLDEHAVWMDTIIFRNLQQQMNKLDTIHYLSLLDGFIPDRILNKKNEKGVKQFAVTSYKTPNLSYIIEYNPVMWQFYRHKSNLRFIQIKHDEVSRSVSEGPNLGPYYTMTAEDFLINDSCIGGHFTSAEILIRDAVSAGKRMLNGESAESIGRLMHKPANHVNWNLMRPIGANVLYMPDNVVLYNTRLSDYSPRISRILMSVFVILFILLLLFSLIFSLRLFLRQKKAKKMIKSQALNAIHMDRLLDLAIRTSGALMWDDKNKGNILNRIKTDDKSSELLKIFMERDRDGLYQMQFRGSIDGGGEHWYDIRMNVSNNGLKQNGFLLNIDKMKEAQNKVMEAHQMLLEARAREGFISSMNHEIRTPLHAVVGFSTELARPDAVLSDEEIATYAEIIESNASQLLKIINDILVVTLMKNANVTARMERISIKSLLNTDKWPEAKKMLKYRRNILEIEEGGDDVSVNLDISMASAVIENLLINASNFSNEGSRINVGWQKLPDGDVRIWVKDEGIGITERHFGMIFEPFFKVNSFSPGCGLGLSICKTYMDKMGGEILVDSQPGQGSVFTLVFKS